MGVDEIEVGRRLVVRGIVQGVGFRWFVSSEARRLGLQGWVRNLRDGGVEALVCGPQAQVAELIHLVGLGPPHARVDKVLVEDSPERATGFEQRSTI